MSEHETDTPPTDEPAVEAVSEGIEAVVESEAAAADAVVADAVEAAAGENGAAEAVADAESVGAVEAVAAVVDVADVAAASAGEPAPGSAAATETAGDAPAPAPAKAKAKGADKPADASAAGRGRPRRQLAELVVGEKLKGKVVGLSKFGAFVDIGATTDGLVHLTELPGKRVRTAEEAVSSGDSVEVFVKDVDLDKGRISLSMRPPVGRPMNGLAVGDVVTGHVTTITKYGAFIDIGSDTEGLVHISEMSSGFVSRPEDIVQAGGEVEVRIKELDVERKRISLSMVGLAGDAAAAAEAEQRASGGGDFGGGGGYGGGGGGGGRDRGRSRDRDREPEVYVPEEPAERMPTVVELALRRAMGEDVDGDGGERGKGKGDKGKKAAAREMSDVYAKMLADYRESKGES
ncbi:MAG: S1 RNA-binding domain-containing protein [Ardenticatenales bacterium]|nr:S1 RNA-binding domain-containing protein [Ardenticatenales bacterium]